MNIFVFVLLAFQLGASAPVIGQTLRYVMPIAAGSGDGSSWENASNNLGQILDSSLPGDIVWVAEGNYYGEATTTSSFVMKDGVTVLGGFPGSVPGTNDNRDPSAYPTILNAVGERRVLRCPSNTSTLTVWDGFVLQDGNIPQFKGGGAYLENYSVLRNCVIRNCAAAQGGGIYLFTGGEVHQSLIENNLGDLNGGGVLIHQDGLVQNCVIRSNDADNAGGVAVELQGTVLNTVIANNSAETVSGGLFASGNALLVNCTVAKNFAMGSVGEQILTNAKVYNSVFWGNVPLMSHSESTVINCAIEGWLNPLHNILLDGVNNSPNLPSPWFSLPSATAGSAGDVDGLVDWSILNESALVNHGSNEWILTTMNTDLVGAPRIFGALVDVGAYELQEIPTATENVSRPVLHLTIQSGRLVVSNLMPGQCVDFFSSSGQLVHQQIAASDQVIIQTGLLAPGLYLIKCGTRVQKWIKYKGQ